MGPVAGARVPSFAHPGSHPGIGHTGFAAVSSTTSTTAGSNPAMTNYGHQLMMAAKAGEQISDLYRRRDSGYTHHVSNSNYHHIPSTAAPQVHRGPAQQQQQSLQRSSSSRSLSSYLQGTSGPHPSIGGPVVSGSSSNSLSKPKSKPRGLMAPPAGKDLSSPLFVDCSIEYELPNAPKIPKNSSPILMIHPGYKPPRATPRVVQPATKPKAVPVAVSQQTAPPECNGHRGGICQCKAPTSTNNATPQKRGGVKRTYATAGLNNDFYKHLNQPQPHPQQSAAHAYFDNTSNTSTSALEAYAAAKRSRLQMAENQKLFNQQQQLFQQQQQQQAQMLRHYQQTYYNRQQQQQTTQQQIKQQQTDLRISSFQQITPPESLAFWQQQQQLTATAAQQHQQNQQLSTACRSGCCGHTGSTQTTALNQRYVNKYSPTCPAAPVCCYTLPPTPMVTSNPTANPFCLGCAQGKCQQMAAAANAAAAKKVNMGIMRSL